MVGKGDDFGFSFENGSSFEKNNNVEDRERPYLSSAVSADEGHFSKFFIGIHDYAKRKNQRIIEINKKKKSKVKNSCTYCPKALQAPHHSYSDRL